MKKVLWVMGLIGLLSANVFAQRMHFNSAQYKQVYTKVFNLERLALEDIPDGYDYKADRDSKNLFYGTKNIAVANPKSFNAAWNYALLTAASETATIREIQEAYKLYEKAKQLRPGDVKVYTQQIGLLYIELWGDSKYFPNPQISDSEIIDVYKSRPDMARKMLGLIEREISLLGITPEQGTADVTLAEHIEDAYFICRALNRVEAAAKWNQMRQSSERYIQVTQNKLAEAVYMGAKAGTVVGKQTRK